jgi:hypothetical protein
MSRQTAAGVHASLCNRPSLVPAVLYMCLSFLQPISTLNTRPEDLLWLHSMTTAANSSRMDPRETHSEPPPPLMKSTTDLIIACQPSARSSSHDSSSSSYRSSSSSSNRCTYLCTPAQDPHAHIQSSHLPCGMPTVCFGLTAFKCVSFMACIHDHTSLAPQVSLPQTGALNA